MTSRQRVGIFGGTFDPIHLGHLAAAEDVAYRLELDRVLFVPNRVPPHKRTARLASAKDRLAMVELAIAGNPCFEISHVELEREGPSYSLETLRTLRRSFAVPTDMCFLVGVDALPTLHTWHQPEILLEEFRVVVMDRPGVPSNWTQVEERFPGIRKRVQIVHVVQFEISASDIRSRVKDGRSIRYRVVPEVEIYIRDHHLYESV